MSARASPLGSPRPGVQPCMKAQIQQGGGKAPAQLTMERAQRSPEEKERTKQAFGKLVRAKEVATRIEWQVENCVYKIQEYPRGTALFSPSFFHDVYV